MLIEFNWIVFDADTVLGFTPYSLLTALDDQSGLKILF